MNALPVEVTGITRRFGRRTALAGVDLSVAPGEMVGLVGPNGSGKTTLLKILGGFLRPTAGEARVFGLAPYRDQARVMVRARFAFAPPALFDALTAREHLVGLTRIRAVDMPRVTSRDVDAALETVGLRDRADDRVRAFSFGMRQRLLLAQALLPRPELLVLDEPTDGLDPLAVRELREVLVRLRAEHGVAILLSSHLLVEIERLVDRLLVLDEGAVLFSGPPRELLDGRARIRIGVDDAGRATELLHERGIDFQPISPERAPADDEVTELELSDGGLDLEAARTLLADSGLRLLSWRRHRPTLEQALLERLRERAGEPRVDESRAGTEVEA